MEASDKSFSEAMLVGYTLVGRYLGAFARLESNLDRGIGKLLKLDNQAMLILADNLAFVAKLKIAESIVKALYSAEDGTHFKDKKDSRLAILNKIMEINNLRVMMAHKEFFPEEEKVVFNNFKAKGTLLRDPLVLTHKELEEKTKHVGDVSDDLSAFIDSLNEWELKADFRDPRNSMLIPILL